MTRDDAVRRDGALVVAVNQPDKSHSTRPRDEGKIKQVIGTGVLLKAEAVKRRFLPDLSLAHHRHILLSRRTGSRPLR